VSEPPRRPTLRLKLGTPLPAALARAPIPAPAPPPAPPQPAWKCRPCGTAFDPPSDLADDERVRCPSCNAKVGLAGDFKLDPPPLERLRARPAKAPPPKPPARPRSRFPR
jgi:DNA-directed RNA polymerase subunit RPC12/RpoP